MIKRSLLLMLGVFLTLTQLSAQDEEYMYELGLGGGISTTYGDINKSKLIYNPGFAAEIIFRYNLNSRWSFAADLSSNGIQGNSLDFDYQFPDGAIYTFDNCYWQLGLRPEFNFWNYGFMSDYREMHRAVPFITAGIGLGWVTGNKTKFTMSLPLGAGLKYKLAPRWNVQWLWLFTKTFSDEIDSVKDPMLIKSSGLKNTDWVGSMMLSVTFDFGVRCIQCNNSEL